MFGATAWVSEGPGGYAEVLKKNSPGTGVYRKEKNYGGKSFRTGTKGREDGEKVN